MTKYSNSLRAVEPSRRVADSTVSRPQPDTVRPFQSAGSAMAAVLARIPKPE